MLMNYNAVEQTLECLMVESALNVEILPCCSFETF